jgi:hypothetical protein
VGLGLGSTVKQMYTGGGMPRVLYVNLCLRSMREINAFIQSQFHRRADQSFIALRDDVSSRCHHSMYNMWPSCLWCLLPCGMLAGLHKCKLCPVCTQCIAVQSLQDWVDVHGSIAAAACVGYPHSFYNLFFRARACMLLKQPARDNCLSFCSGSMA